MHFSNQPYSESNCRYCKKIALVCIQFHFNFPFSTTQKRFQVKIQNFNNLNYSIAFKIYLKKFLSSFPENILKSITTSEFVTYESIEAFGFANMVCYNRNLNLFYFSPNASTETIRLIFDCYYNFLQILGITENLLIVLSNITVISALFF